MVNIRDKYVQGSPDYFPEDLYWKFSEFEELSVEQVKKCCYIALKAAMEDADTTMRMYYGECKKIIERRGL